MTKPPARETPGGRRGRGRGPQGGPQSGPKSRPQTRQPRAPRPAATSGWESRLAASALLHTVMDNGADLESAMTGSEAFSRLEGSDRGLARAIASSALRCLGRIDWGLAQLVDRPLDQIEPPVLAVLRAGAAQIWVQETAPYAAVSSTVEAARHWRPASRGGKLINAVLRRVGEKYAVYDEAPATAIWPDWLAAKYRAALGAEGADALALLQMEEPAIDLSLKRGVDPDELAERLEGEALANGSVRIEAGRVLSELPGYAEGDWWVQDAGATIAASIMGDIEGKQVIDLCAAPGGKAMQLAAAGAKVTALDISRQRLDVLRENVQRTGLAMEIIEADVRSWRPAELADAILLDAPCSAMGVLRRHPEAAWQRDPASLAKYSRTQRALIDAAGEMLKPGGMLIYCVCTPFPEEGLELIAGVLEDGGWRRKVLQPVEVPGFAGALTAEGDVLSAPPKRDPKSADESEIAASAIKSDVFYIARLERQSL